MDLSPSPKHILKEESTALRQYLHLFFVCRSSTNRSKMAAMNLNQVRPYSVSCQGICSEYLYDLKCNTDRCHLTHLKIGSRYMDSHSHLDALWDRHSFYLPEWELPPHFMGTVASFCFPDLHYLLPRLTAGHNVVATVGVHPKFARQFDLRQLSFIEECLSLPRVVAVGETGLDRTKVCMSPMDV
jgi:hypothetical protein